MSISPLTRKMLTDHIADTTTAHGIGQKTRSLWFSYADFISDSAGSVTMGSPPNSVKASALADATTSGVLFCFQMPADAVGGAVTIRPVWAPNSTISSSHAVRWQMNIKLLTSGDVSASGGETAWTEAVSAWTASYVNKAAGQNSGSVQPAAGDVVRLNLRRLGSDAADTATTIVNLIGIIIEYVAIR